MLILGMSRRRTFFPILFVFGVPNSAFDLTRAIHVAVSLGHPDNHTVAEPPLLLNRTFYRFTKTTRFYLLKDVFAHFLRKPNVLERNLNLNVIRMILQWVPRQGFQGSKLSTLSPLKISHQRFSPAVGDIPCFMLMENQTWIERARSFQSHPQDGGFQSLSTW